MKYRTLGTTGLTVSEIGFGGWGIGGTRDNAVAYGPTDDHASLRALRRAVALGVTFYDTADLYGRGHSEELIGAALRKERQHVVIASKVGLLGPDGSQDFSPAHIRQSIEGTLARLQTDYLDLYQLHNPSVEVLEREPQVLGALQALQRAGTIRAIGVSARSPDEALTIAKRFSVKCLQVNFNLLDQRALENGLLAFCQAAQVGLIGRTPLCFGFLTGAYSARSKFGEGDHRTRWPVEQRALWTEASRRLTSARESKEDTDAQFALRFCLSYPGVSTVIPGMLTGQQVEENIPASDFGPLTALERVTCERMYREQPAFLGGEPQAMGQGASDVFHR